MAHENSVIDHYAHIDKFLTRIH